MPAGRPRKPTQLKVLHGSVIRHNVDAEPKPDVPSKLPPPPDWLPTLAKNHWRKIGPELHEVGLLTTADLESFARYCVCYAQVRRCVKLLEKEGYTVSTEQGAKSHPLWQQLTGAIDLCQRYEARFGMTPSARTSIEVKPKKEKPAVESRKRGG